MDNLTLIAAIGKNNELGKNNDLIWRLKKDMQFFKENTIGKPIVMGRKTLESLPKMLPNRQHIVLTKQKIEIPNVIIVHSKEELFRLLNTRKEEIMVIGGSSIYQLLINDASRILLTEIDATDEQATVYFPKFNKENWLKKILKEEKEKEISYRHVEYTKKLIR